MSSFNCFHNSFQKGDHILVACRKLNDDHRFRKDALQIFQGITFRHVAVIARSTVVGNISIVFCLHHDVRDSYAEKLVD